MNKLKPAFSRKRVAIKGSVKVPRIKRPLGLNSNYEPTEHRNKNRQLNDFEALIILVRGTLGPGFVALPYAFKLSGYVPAILTLVIYPSFFVYCSHLLINGMHLLCKEYHLPILSYSDAIHLALKGGPPIFRPFSKASVVFLDIIMVAYHFCVTVSYVGIIATMVQNVIDDYIISLDSRLLMVGMIVFLVPIFTIRTLKNMVAMWTLANFLIMTSFLLLLFYLIDNLPSFKHMSPFESPLRYAEALGFFLFSMQSIGTVLPIEAKMKHPKKLLGWKGLVVRVHIVTVFLYIIFGFFGNWRYGVDTEDNIAMNVSPVDINAQLARLFLATALYLSYPLHATVVVHNVWFHWLARLIYEEDRQPLEFVIRLIVILLSVILSVVLVNLTSFVPFTASFCVTMLGMVFPAILNISLMYHNGFGKFKWMLFKDIFLILLGIVAAVGGMAASIRIFFNEMRLI